MIMILEYQMNAWQCEICYQLSCGENVRYLVHVLLSEAWLSKQPTWMESNKPWPLIYFK